MSTNQAAPADEVRPMVVRTPGGDYPLIVGPGVVGVLTAKTGRSVRDDFEAGRLPSMPRPSGSGARWRIATAVLMAQLGVPYEVVPADSVPASVAS